ncbi:MAG: pitrilysin family protein [Planctomycetota bacterium]
MKRAACHRIGWASLPLWVLVFVGCQESELVLKQTTSLTADTPESAPESASESIAEEPAYTVLQRRDDRVIAALPNRMILIAQDLPTAPVVTAQAWVKTGSLYEQEHVGAGLSHFLEHLVSGGSTTNRTEEQSTAVLGRMGAATNAATSLDTVRYYITTTTPHTAEAVHLLSDWMRNNVVSQREFERERQVIQSEFSMGQGDPGRIQWKLTQEARYADTPTHPGAHPTIGYFDEFLDVTRDELEAFYRRMYVPNNLVFLVVGDIDPDAVIRQLAGLWADAEARELPDLAFPLAVGEAEPVQVTGVAAISRPRVRLFWPGVRLGAEHDFALDLLAGVLGQGESSRLVRELRDERQLVTAIDAYNFSAHWGEGFFGIDYELADPDAAAAVREAVEAQLDRLRLEPVTDAELDRVKRRTRARVLKSGQSAAAVAGRLARDVIATGDPDYSARYAEAIQRLTPADLTAAAVALLDPDAASVVRLDPIDNDDAIVYPTRPAEAAADGGPTEPVDLDNAVLLSRMRSGLDADAAARDAVAAGDPEVRTLGNGLTVIVQRSTVAPAVAMQLYTRGGLLAEEPGREGVANAAYAMLRRGTTQRSADALAEAIDDLGATLAVGSGNNTGYVTATALRENWTEVAALMAEVVTEPAFDPAQWDTLRPQLLAAIDRATDRWSGELRAEFRQAYYGDHPWSQLPLGRKEVVAELTAERLRSFYESRLAASRSVLAVVGDVEPAAAFAEAESLFGPLPAGGADTEAPIPAPPTPGLTLVETDKPVVAAQVGYGPGITRDSPDYAALRVLSRVIGDFPAGWLQQELRGRGPGLVYASSAGNVTGLVPGYFTMLFNATPETGPEALRRTLAVADRARTELIDDATLARAKAKVLTDEFTGRQTHADLAAGAALDRLYGVEDLTGQAFLQQVESLTARDLRRVAKKYFGEPVVVVVSNAPLDEAALRGMVGTGP